MAEQPCAWSNDTAEHFAACVLSLFPWYLFHRRYRTKLIVPLTVVCQIRPVAVLGDCSMFLATCSKWMFNVPNPCFLNKNHCFKYLIGVPCIMLPVWESLFQVNVRCFLIHVSCMSIPVPSECSMFPDPYFLYEFSCSKLLYDVPWSMFLVWESPCFLFHVSIWESMFQVTVRCSLYHVPCQAIPVTNDCLMFLCIMFLLCPCSNWLFCVPCRTSPVPCSLCYVLFPVRQSLCSRTVRRQSWRVRREAASVRTSFPSQRTRSGVFATSLVLQQPQPQHPLLRDKTATATTSTTSGWNSNSHNVHYFWIKQPQHPLLLDKTATATTSTTSG